MALIDGFTAPRRGIDPVDDGDAPATASEPRRASSGRKPLFRTGLAIAATAVTLGTAGIAAAALNPSGPDSPSSNPVVASFDRGVANSRNHDREALDPSTVANLAAQRAAALHDLSKNVANSQAANSSASRQKILESNKQGIEAENKRLEEEKNLLHFPAEGKPGSPWGMRLHPILGYYRMHWGMDIGAACGSPLRAVYDGTVISASYDGGSGNNVKINHGKFRGKDLQTNSLHMTRYIVAPGQKVKKGEIIGYTGSTGLSTECHLHFETIWGGTNVDPLPLLNKPS